MDTIGFVFTQSRALLVRYGIVLMRTPIKSLIRIILLPSLLLFMLYKFTESKKSNDKFVTYQVTNLITFEIMFATCFSMTNLAALVTTDRSTCFRSLMESMGLSRLSYYIATSLYYMIQTLPVLLSIQSIIATGLIPDSESSQVTTGFILFLFTLQTVAFILFLSSFVTSSFILIFYLAIFIQFGPYHAFVQWCLKQTNTVWHPYLLFVSAIVPSESINRFADAYMACKNCDQPPPNPSTAQPSRLILTESLFWTTICFLLTYYLEEVCPWQADSPKKGLLFCLGLKSDDTPSSRDNHVNDSRFFEAPAQGRETGIKIKNVTKKYGPLLAVNNLTFEIYKGETTLLLGHNGAGKTTLMDMILGLNQPTKGVISIKGSSRGSIGVCPQSSILDENLTIKQHLELFYDIKQSCSSRSRSLNVSQTLNDVSLTPHTDKLPSELSGGMKRKLCLGMAFVGNSDILILDEPSSGLDPDSRMFVWDAIRRYRSDKTVLLSTQHMEEADYLGDRIAIMSAGTLICCGSSTFLNKTFGQGYKIRFASPRSKQEKILKFVRRHFENARTEQALTLASSHSNSPDDKVQDMVIDLRSDQSDLSETKLIKLLEDLKMNSDALHVKSYSLKGSSIEDVMLKTDKKRLKTEHSESLGLNMTSRDDQAFLVAATGTDHTDSIPEQLHLLKALMIKHWHTLRHDWQFFLFYRIIIPVLGVYLFVQEMNVPMDSFSSFNMNLLMVLNYAHYPVLERASKFKTMQLTSLANYFIYWISQLIVDIISAMTLVIAFEIFIPTVFTGEILVPGANFHAIAITSILFFVISAALLSYIISHIFNDSKNALFYIILIWMTSAFVQLFLWITWIIYSIATPKGIPTNATDLQSPTIAPLFVATLPTDALAYIGYGFQKECYIRPSLLSNCQDKGSSEVAKGLVALTCQILAYAAILLAIEYYNLSLSKYLTQLYDLLNSLVCSICRRAPRNESQTHRIPLDEDVVKESRTSKSLINHVPRDVYSLVASNLSKSYKYHVTVVDDLSFTVQRGECFGLLGVNGAGKTTTFSMLTADIPSDKGNVWLDGHYLKDGVTAYRHGIGYDPQSNPEMGLTPIEALYLMARLRCVPEGVIPELVRAILDLLDMSEHSTKKTSELSGGTRRKLALGMALIGNPHMLALDEPTAGVDPVARRGIWQLLRTLRSRQGAAIIIASHAMEECEAICDRISIMARGQFRCIGTFLHLRDKFAQGTRVKVTFSSQTGSSVSPIQNSTTQRLIQEIEAALTSIDSSTILVDRNINSASFKMQNRKVDHARVFTVLRQFRLKNPQINYTINDSSLEDIFITLAQENQNRQI